MPTLHLNLESFFWTLDQRNIWVHRSILQKRKTYVKIGLISLTLHRTPWCPLSPQAVGLLWWWFHFKLVTCSSIKARGTSEVGCALGGWHTTICWLFLPSLQLVVTLHLPSDLRVFGLGFHLLLRLCIWLCPLIEGGETTEYIIMQSSIWSLLLSAVN
jgi:hypothetical protein